MPYSPPPLQVAEDLSRLAARQAKTIEEQKECPLRVATVQFTAQLHYLAEKVRLVPHPLGKRRGTGHGARLLDIEQNRQRPARGQQIAGLNLSGERLQGRSRRPVFHRLTRLRRRQSGRRDK